MADSRIRALTGEVLAADIQALLDTLYLAVDDTSFVDAKKILTNVSKDEFVAQTLAIELYLEAGIRAVEIGALLADRDPKSRENRYPELEFLRLAIPRRTYTNNHMDVIAVALKNVFDRRETITRGYKITFEEPIMRHFTIELEPM